MTLNAPFKDPEELISELEDLLSKEGPMGFLFDDCRDDKQYQAFKVDKEHAPKREKDDIWFFGDIHGDLSGMIAAIGIAEKKSAEDGKTPHYVFLGDFTDRGPLDYLVLLKLYSIILDEELRSRICIIAGNHDECLGYSDENEVFTTTVQPAEFSDWLNAKTKKGDEWHRLGKATIKFFKRMPRAVFLPDGLFFAHAGVPHIDLHEGIDTLKALNEKQCLEDFVWLRAHERAKSKRPNRMTRGSQFGRKDFYAFCEIASNLLEQPVERMLRGHDHYLVGYKHYEKYEEKSMLTLNTRCIQPDTMGGPYAEQVCIARWVKDAMPEIYEIKTPRSFLEKVHPPEKVASEGSLDEETPAAEEPMPKPEGDPEKGTSTEG